VAWLVKTVFTEEEKRYLRGIAGELREIRNVIDELVEKLVKLSDKEFMNSFEADQIDLKETEVLRCTEKLQEQLDRAEKDL
jgi:hypothetical protein